MIGQNNHEIQSESRTTVVDRGIHSNNMNCRVQINSPQVDMYTLEEKIVIKVQREVYSVMDVMATVKTRV